MAISTMYTFLMTSTSGSTYSKLVDIKDFPDLGGAPEMIDFTTLTNSGRVSMPGIQETEALTFTGNYTATDFAAVKALDDGAEHYFAVWFGGTESSGTVTPDGSKGKFAFKGYLSCFVNGGGVNEIVNMTITIAATTEIGFTAS